MRDTLHVVSYSGGMGSFAEAKSCIDKYGKENVLLLFADVGMEDPDLYRFIDETVAFLGCELVVLKQRTPWELFKESKFIGNSIADTCSQQLKRVPLSRWLDSNYGIDVEIPHKDLNGEDLKNPNGDVLTHVVRMLDNVEVHLGIDFTEHHRLTAVQKKVWPKVYRSTLVEDGRFIEKNYSEQFGIKRPYLYKLYFPHNNCGGFCVKSGLGQFKKLYEELPERYKWHEEQEQEVIALGGKPFLRKVRNKKTYYISMKDYRKYYLEKNDTDMDKYDLGGCGCAI